MRHGPLLVLALFGCGEEATPDETTPQTGCGHDVPVLTWEGFGEGFLKTYCQGCHASTAADRHGAPENVVFDTEADAIAWKERIAATAATEPFTMPPGGGPTEEERARLVTWLRCIEE